MTANVLSFPGPPFVQRFLYLGPNRFFGQWGILITTECGQHLSVDELIEGGRRVLILPGREMTEETPCEASLCETLEAFGGVLITFVFKTEAEAARRLARKFARPVGDIE
jgi:hypothetical protein